MKATDPRKARAVAVSIGSEGGANVPLRVLLSLLVIAIAAGVLLVAAPAHGEDTCGDTCDDSSITIGRTGAITINRSDCYTIPDGETREVDLYMWARCIEISGTLDGDIVAGFQEGTISGLVTQDVNGFAETMWISGEVLDDVRFACETLYIDGHIGGDLIAAGKDIQIREGAVIDGDVLVACGTFSLDGEIGGRARVVTGFVDLDGTIAGNAEITTDGGISVGGRAHIGGDLVYEGPSRVTFPDGSVVGEITYHRIEKDEFDPEFNIPEGLGAFMHLLGFLAALVAGTIIVALTPDHARRTAETIRTKPLKSLGIGFVAYICMPIVLLILLVLIITIPLMFVVGLAYLIVLYIAKFYFSIWLGNLILRRSGRTDVSPIPSMLLGLVIVYLVTAIPIMGTLAGIVIIFFGFGALLQRKETRLDAAFEAPQVTPGNGLPNAFPGTGTGA